MGPVIQKGRAHRAGFSWSRRAGELTMRYGGSCFPPSVSGRFPTSVRRKWYHSSWGHPDDPASWLWRPGAPCDTPVCLSHVAVCYMCRDLQKSGKDLSRNALACTQYSWQQGASEKHLPSRAGLFPPVSVAADHVAPVSFSHGHRHKPSTLPFAIYVRLKKEKFKVSFSLNLI